MGLLCGAKRRNEVRKRPWWHILRYCRRPSTRVCGSVENRALRKPRRSSDRPSLFVRYDGGFSVGPALAAWQACRAGRHKNQEQAQNRFHCCRTWTPAAQYWVPANAGCVGARPDFHRAVPATETPCSFMRCDSVWIKRDQGPTSARPGSGRPGVDRWTVPTRRFRSNQGTFFPFNYYYYSFFMSPFGGSHHQPSPRH